MGKVMVDWIVVIQYPPRECGLNQELALSVPIVLAVECVYPRLSEICPAMMVVFALPYMLDKRGAPRYVV